MARVIVLTLLTTILLIDCGWFLLLEFLAKQADGDLNPSQHAMSVPICSISEFLVHRRIGFLPLSSSHDVSNTSTRVSS